MSNGLFPRNLLLSMTNKCTLHCAAGGSFVIFSFLSLSLSLSPSFPLTRPSSLVRPRPMAPLPSIHPPVFLSFFRRSLSPVRCSVLVSPHMFSGRPRVSDRARERQLTPVLSSLLHSILQSTLALARGVSSASRHSPSARARLL